MVVGVIILAPLLSLAWLLSGVASIYLLYRWFTTGKKVFGGDDKKDSIAFLVMVITGLNLGYAAIGTNIGMGFVWGSGIADLVFKATAVVYIVTAIYVWKRWKASGEVLFEHTPSPDITMSEPPERPQFN